MNCLILVFRTSALQDLTAQGAVLPLFLDLCDVTLLKQPPNIRFFHFETIPPSHSLTRKRRNESVESDTLQGGFRMSTDDPEILRLDSYSATKRKKASVSTVDTFHTGNST